MGQMANVVVYDGEATPVAHTFVPVSVTRDSGEVVAFWRKETPGVPYEAQGRLTMKLKQLPSKVFRVSSRVEIPVMESVSGQNAAGYTAAPAVAYIDAVECIGYFHPRSLTQGRTNVRHMAAGTLFGYTTSVGPVIAGPIPELFDQLRTVT